jgi:hypothetical protein
MVIAEMKIILKIIMEELLRFQLLKIIVEQLLRFQQYKK